MFTRQLTDGEMDDIGDAIVSALDACLHRVISTTTKRSTGA